MKAVQAFNSAHETCTAAEGLLASSAPHVMMRLRDATLRAAAANKVALEAEQEKDAAEKAKEDLKCELCGKRSRPEASTIGAGTGRVCANFRVWVLRGLYCLLTTTMNSDHDASEFVKNHIYVN